MALASRSSITHRSAAAPQLSVALKRGQVQVCRSRLLHGDHGHGNHAVAWHEKHKELWLELQNEQELQSACSSLPDGKMLVVDYYASWCAVCKTAYPGLCRAAANKEHQQHFVFAKGSLDHAEIKESVKKEGIRGIPHFSIYNSSGTKLLGMGASFKKLEAINYNLRAIAKHKEEVINSERQLTLDPNSFVMIPGVPVPAA